MHVHQILKVKGTAVATTTPAASLADATASLRDHGVGALVVSSDGRTIDGIVSERDVRPVLAVDGPTLARWSRRPCRRWSPRVTVATRSMRSWR